MDANNRGLDTRTDVQMEPYGVRIGASFSTYREELRAKLALIIKDENPRYTDDEADKAADKYIGDVLSANDGVSLDSVGAKEQFGAQGIAKVSDSSIFGNEAINPYAGFCRDDDIVPVAFRSSESEHGYGMGRVYSEIYNDTQQIVYFQLGVPRYRNLQDLMTSSDEDAEKLNETGDSSILSKLAGGLMSVAGSAIKLAIELPWLPFEWAFRAMNTARDYQITEYFYFREQMMAYFKLVNSILHPIAVNLGLFGTLGQYFGKDDVYLNKDGSVNPENLPAILKNGPDIFSILQSKSARYGKVTVSLDDALNDGGLQAEEDKLSEGGAWDSIGNYFTKLWGGYKSSALDANKFIAFRIEKGGDNANEQFSNSLRESSLAQRLNARVDQNRQRNYSDEAMSEGALAWLKNKYTKAKSLFDTVKGVIDNKLDPTSITDAIEYMATGNGFYDLPQQWSGSNFSRSISLNFRLRSKTGGDNLSVFTNIFIPLSCLLAMAMPRASGSSTYNSPFIIRAWCRGMFSIPAGMVTSLSVTRGDSEFGWSRNRIPTIVNVSMSITDLSPIMFLSFADGGGVINSWRQIFANNSKFLEYVNTMTGMSLRQRYYTMGQILRNVSAAWMTTKKNFLTPTVHGMKWGDSVIGKIHGAFASLESMRTGI